MMTNVRFLLIFSLLMLTMCSSPSPNPDAGATAESKRITLASARAVVPGKTTTTGLALLLGPPSSIRQLEDGNRKIWTYLRKDDPATRRMYALVIHDSGLVKSVTWNVFEGEPETDVEYAKKALGSPRFERSEPKWTKGDTAPDEVYFFSKEARITIVLRKTLNQVDMIVWN